MAPVRRAVSLMAGYGVQMWTFLQDLGQLRRLYPKDWESFVANADVVQAFGVTDQFTAEYLSKMAGTATVFDRSTGSGRSRGKQTSRSTNLPATLSRRVLTGLLRDKLGYDGVLFSDDLEMAGVAAHFDLADAAVRTVLAGADVALICHTPARQFAALDALERAMRDGVIPRERLDQSLRRLGRLCERFVRPPNTARPSLLFASEGHQTLRRRVAASPASRGDPTQYVTG